MLLLVLLEHFLALIDHINFAINTLIIYEIILNRNQDIKIYKIYRKLFNNNKINYYFFW